MTFDNDMCWFELQGCTRRLTCKEMNVDWPPPERLTYQGTRMVMTRITRLSDERRASMAAMTRIATYKSAGVPAHIVGF